MVSNLNLLKLIQKAQGSRTARKFADDAKINSGYLSRIYNEGIKPSVKILKAITEVAENNVTLDELLLAAEYIESNRCGNCDKLENLDVNLKKFITDSNNIKYLEMLYDLEKNELLGKLYDKIDIIKKLL
jgi:transcriptional regulator with XRE-family HTH domain